MMKNIITTILAVSVICLTVYIFSGSNNSEKATIAAPVVAAFTVSPEIPDEIEFCGDKIDLSRYNVHEGMDRELTSFTYFHSSTMLLLKRANRYFPVIEPILKRNGIPDDFKYLAVIESNLDPNVTSPARAVGIWQFMESTAKQYGLRITPTVDERRNISQSTEAACLYLKEAYRKYGDWVAVACSYNAGMGRISGQLEKQNENSVLNLYLVEETLRYPYRIFAIKQIFENPYKYGYVLKAENLYRPIDCEEIRVNEDIPDLVAYAQKYGVTYLDLKLLNPWLRDIKLETRGNTYIILIPDKNKLFYDKSSNNYVHDRRWVVN
ncbi:MAG: lytic transglycosylase domain-containing protein [Tannerella sp.]|nr:lytic transglycosylase domain-containing protein [Tannerella sp.]